ncbi:MAG: TonB-dependent receptor plug domain-containing protein [Pseudomonadales bacterium]
MRHGLIKGLATIFIAISPFISTQADMLEDELLELYADDETVSISTGTNKPIRLAPSVATVITQEDIERLGAVTLDEILETVPGLHVSVSKTSKLNSVYSIRGIHTARNAQVLVLIDDLPIRQVYGGGRPSNFLLPVENIKRIEIVRGPGSAVFGADAFAGVINVITKGAAELDGLRGSVKLGSFNTENYALQYGKIFDNEWQIAFSIEHANSDGDDDRIVERDIQSFFDSFPTTLANASQAPGSLSTQYSVNNIKLGLRNENWDIAWHSWMQSDAGLGQGGAQALDSVGSVDAEYHSISASYSAKLTDNFSYKAKVWASLYDEENFTVLFPAGARIPVDEVGNLDFGGRVVLFSDGVIGTPSGQENRYAAELIGSYSGWKKHDVRLAAGFERQTGEATESKNFGEGAVVGIPDVITGELTNVTNTEFVYADIEAREIAFVSIQDNWAFLKDWELTVGVRYDNYSDFGGTVNPRAALVWATSYSLTTKLLYGRAFRAPSNAELFAINNPVILGNPDLEPETTDTIELAFDYRFSSNLSTKLNFFWYEIDDAIDFVDPPPELGLPQGSLLASNARTQDGKGFEFELAWQAADKLSFAANYSRQFAEAGETGERVEDAPGSQLFVSSNIELPSLWRLNLNVNWISDRRRGLNDNREFIGDFALVNAALNRSNFFGALDFGITIRNIFDESASEPSNSGAVLTAIPGDLPLPGRSIMFSVGYQFSN